MALTVVQLKYSPDFPMPALKKMFRRRLTCPKVIHADMHGRQLRIAAVYEYYRDSLTLKFPVQLKVWIGQPAFCRLGDHAVYHILMDEIFQDIPLALHRIVGECNLQRILRL